MKKKGFITLLLITSVLLIVIEIHSIKAIDFQSKAISIEKVDLIRTELEYNTDSIIEYYLRKGLKQGMERKEIKEMVLSELFSYYEKFKKAKFYSTSFFTGNYSLLNSIPKKRIELNDLMENFNLIILENNSLKIGLISFTGGILKNNLIFSEINAGAYKNYFLIPLDYSLKVIE